MAGNRITRFHRESRIITRGNRGSRRAAGVSNVVAPSLLGGRLMDEPA